MMQEVRNARWTVSLDERIGIAAPTAADRRDGVVYLLAGPNGELRIEVMKEAVEVAELDDAYRFVLTGEEG